MGAILREEMGGSFSHDDSMLSSRKEAAPQGMAATTGMAVLATRKGRALSVKQIDWWQQPQFAPPGKGAGPVAQPHCLFSHFAAPSSRRTACASCQIRQDRPEP